MGVSTSIDKTWSEKTATQGVSGMGENILGSNVVLGYGSAGGILFISRNYFLNPKHPNLVHVSVVAALPIAMSLAHS